MHVIHLNINSLLSKISETHYIAKLTNTTVIGSSKTKLYNTVWSSEREIQGYDLVRFGQSQRGASMACFFKNCFINLVFGLIQSVFL